MRKYTSAAQMSLWKWILCLVGGLFLFLLLYAFSSFGLDAFKAHTGWYCGACVLTAALALLFYAMWANLTEKRPVEELSLRKAFPHLGMGLATGALFFMAVTGVMALMGSYEITGASFHLFPQLQAFYMFLVVAVFEEIIFRGILFRLIDDRWNTAAALVVSAILFGLIHKLNPGGTWWGATAIAIEAGLLLGAAYKFSGSLWLPIGIHWAWNYFQGNVFGFAVSGGAAGDHVFSAIISGSDLVTGGLFGAEASLITVGFGLLITAVFLLCPQRPRH